MKKYILSCILMLATFSIYAQREVKNDTIAVNNTEINKIITDETTTSKGKKVTKYYFIYGGELIQASRHVVESYNLCQKHGAKCHLAMVVNKKTNRKRIILH
jgi:hypothetical protein|uniref:Uncharacterized protein n=1 Tax=Siphoviridae sp. ctOCb13 TaxID=2825477 RepID=A0A8S5Q1E8_9CAUD|nr:MAG TPA: hypothetical protein [Siphoviridae sp. ctOCb13]